MNMPESFANIILDMDYAWNEGNRIWFIGTKLQCLFCADVIKKEIGVVAKLSDVPISGVKKYAHVIKYEDRFIFLPSISKEILIISVNDECETKVLLKGFDDKEPIWCSAAGIVGDNLYIIESWQSKRIIVLDMVQAEIVSVFDIKCLDEGDEIGVQSTIHKGHIYIPVLNREKIVSFDINTYEFGEHFITGDICGCRSICHDDKYCWVIGEHYGIVRWDPDTNKLSEVAEFPKEFKIFSRKKASGIADWYAYSEKREYVEDNDFFCWDCFCDGKYVWVIPELSDSIVRIDADTMQVKLFSFGAEYDQKDKIYGRRGSEFSLWGVDSDGNLRIVSKRNYRIYCINTESLYYQVEEWGLDKSIFEMILDDLKMHNMIEKKWLRLSNLIDCMIESQSGRKYQEKVEIGEKVYCSVNKD